MILLDLVGWIVLLLMAVTFLRAMVASPPGKTWSNIGMVAIMWFKYFVYMNLFALFVLVGLWAWGTYGA